MWELRTMYWGFIDFSQRLHCTQFSSVQFSHSVVSDSLRPHELQHARPPCPSPTPGIYPNSCPLSQWCHPTISSSATLFCSRLHYFPASRYFLTSWFFASGGQSIGASVLILHKSMYENHYHHLIVRKLWHGQLNN